MHHARNRYPHGLSGLAILALIVTTSLLLAGCQDTEFSWDTRFGGRPNGAFTFYALKSFRTLLPGASYQQWFRAISHYLPSTRLPQNPQMLGARSARSREALS